MRSGYGLSPVMVGMAALLLEGKNLFLSEVLLEVMAEGVDQFISGLQQIQKLYVSFIIIGTSKQKVANQEKETTEQEQMGKTLY